MPTAGRHEGGRGLLFLGGGYEGGKRSRSRRADEKIAIRAAFAAVTEHGARVSRSLKVHTAKALQAKRQTRKH